MGFQPSRSHGCHIEEKAKNNKAISNMAIVTGVPANTLTIEDVEKSEKGVDGWAAVEVVGKVRTEKDIRTYSFNAHKQTRGHTGNYPCVRVFVCVR